MFPKLKESKQFKQDFQLFNKSLEICPDEYKGRMQELYNIWISSADQIDIGHDLYSGATIDPRNLKDTRFTLNRTRTQIFDLLKKLSLDN